VDLLGLIKTTSLTGRPVDELILRDRYMPNDLNLELSQRVSVAWPSCFWSGADCAVLWRGYFLVPVVALLIFLLAAYCWSLPQGRGLCACGSHGGGCGLVIWRQTPTI